MKELLQYLPVMRGQRIGVYGDLIADEYVFGTIHRFSREAPVFIVNYEESKVGPGGAANAVNNIHELGGIAIPFGIIGDDMPGRTLVSLLQEKGIQTDGILNVRTHPTFVKQRIVAGSPHSVKQQILRLDKCLPIPEGAEYHDQLIQKMEGFIDSLDALIISDYGLGVAHPEKFQPLLKRLRAKDIPCFVDSRQRLMAFRGVTAATPNEPEVESLLGKSLDESSLEEAGQTLLTMLELEALLITRGKNGMALFSRNSEAVKIPIFGSTDIVDVTGAGDTVVSTFTLAVSAGASFAEAAKLANCAAGISVMKRGAATVSPQELAEAISISHFQKL